MCGIFGIVANQDSKIDYASLKQKTNQLFKLSELRGKEAAGVCLSLKNKLFVYKEPISASKFIQTNQYQQLFNQKEKQINQPTMVIGHSRLVTDGDRNQSHNNQPVVKNNLVAIHNGIITNTAKLYQESIKAERKYQIDSEAITDIVDQTEKENQGLIQGIKNIFQQIEGSASIALISSQHPELIIATNTGSLYYSELKNQIFVFASEKYILEKFLKLKNQKIERVKANQGYLINPFPLDKKKITFNFLKSNKQISLKKQSQSLIQFPSNFNYQSANSNYQDLNPELLEYRDLYHGEFALKRCKRCILPETFPGIKFDNEGVCNLCRDHTHTQLKSKEKLENELAKYRSNSDKPDCLVAFSGGRDSCYGLHYIKKYLNMNPITFTYDWGMVTDLARRNQARLCGKLGIEHIIISADIKKKRENIRKNIEAWLKKPDLGMIPLFMAGDKQFFYYANKLMKRNKIKLMIFCENEKLENTRFKSGFCGADEGQNRWANMPLAGKAHLTSYYLKQFIKNPSYLNNSLLDTIFAYLSTYLIHHDYLFFYRYIQWDEDEINSTLINQYNWETAPDTDSTWRIGDGTVPFYNYIYYTLAGFTENDTFRSNQIREGLISREQALKMAKKDNQPRYESMNWYGKQINLDLNKAIEIINATPKRYQIK